MTTNISKRRIRSYTLLFVGLLLGIFSSCSSSDSPIMENDFYNEEFNPFVEPDFPFISTYLDARGLGDHFPDDNVVSRGLIVNLGDSTYMCFDRDLLRWSVGWTGNYLNGGMLPYASYADFFNKQHYVPKIAGQPLVANGLYPGWSADSLVFDEVRSDEQLNTGAYWGPLPPEYARWNGVYVYGDKAALSYRVGETDVFEFPGAVQAAGQWIFTRGLEVGSSADTLFMNAAEVRGGLGGSVNGKVGYIHFGAQQDSVVAIGLAGSTDASVKLVDNRYLAVAIPPSSDTSHLTVCLWRGAAEDMESFKRSVDSITVDLPSFRAGSEARWPGSVRTRGTMAPDTAAFVADLLTLPVPNPWKRNVRVIDLAFLDKETIVVSTFEGDIWIAKGIKGKLKEMTWTRFASGLYEPMSVEVYDGQIYVFGKEGIVRLHDLNGDGEADYYENFCDLMQQPPVAYAWAADMVFSEAKGGIFIANGGGVAEGITKPVMSGFRAGTNHSGSILKVSLDGRKVEVIGTGLRAPFLGVHPTTGDITVTDQQGNYVAATPIYTVDRGDFFGVPATAHRDDNPIHKRPLTWIPHRVDRSAAKEVWMTSGQMGPLNDALVHLSFGKPGLFRVLLDSTTLGVQGGVAPLPLKLSTPILKGTLGPADGQLYMAGFNLLGSSSEGVSAIQRLRYTGKPAYMVNDLKIGKQGIIISFDSAMDPEEVVNLENYHIKRWNYQQTEEYGSGHYKLDGTPGEEILPVLASYLSSDGKRLLLLIPDMKFTDQMELVYRLKATDGKVLDDGVWFSVTYTPDLISDLRDFGEVDLSKLDIDPAEIASLVKSEGPITRQQGQHLFNTIGCVGCHSPGTETAGKYGPPFKGMYGTIREMNDGTRIEADDTYLRESILEPSKHVVKGYEAEMPSYVGVLSDADIEAILLYIMYLKY